MKYFKTPNKRMETNDWEQYKRKPEMKPFFPVKGELNATERLLLSCNQIVIPSSLKKNVN